MSRVTAGLLDLGGRDVVELIYSAPIQLPDGGELELGVAQYLLSAGPSYVAVTFSDLVSTIEGKLPEFRQIVETLDFASETQAKGQTDQANKGDSVTQQYSSAPAMTIDPEKSYTATFALEDGSEFKVDLFADKAPKTVNNFVFLARDGFYDGVTFHRVIPASWPRAATPPAPGVEDQATGSRMSSTPTSNTTVPEFCPWPTPDPIPTAASSSSPSYRPLISMAHTPSLVRSWRAWTS